MKLKSKEIIDRPIDEVYNLVKNNLQDIVPYLPNVEKIQTVKRQERKQGLEVENHWYGKADVPSLIKKFVKPELFSYKDFAKWDDAEKKVEYTLESFMGNDLFDAGGVNYFKDLGNGKTELTVTCKIDIHANKIPGVPKLIAKKVLPIFEVLIEKVIGPNLASLGKGLNKYFADH